MNYKLSEWASIAEVIGPRNATSAVCEEETEGSQQ